jgi:hypothetical protein
VTFEIGSALREIGEVAFWLSGLKSIVIPASVGVIDKEAFYCCSSLTSVTFKADSALREIGESAFAESGLTSIVIPASVGVIGKSAFFWCRSLTSVTFETESNLRAVGDLAFEGCPCAGRVEFPATSRDESKE